MTSVPPIKLRNIERYNMSAWISIIRQPFRSGWRAPDVRRRPSPPGQAISKSDAASGCGKEVAVQERRERLAGRAPVQALERAVVEPAVDPPHLLIEDGVERTLLGQDLAHDAVAVLVHPA